MFYFWYRNQEFMEWICITSLNDHVLVDVFLHKKRVIWKEELRFNFFQISTYFQWFVNIYIVKVI